MKSSRITAAEAGRGILSRAPVKVGHGDPGPLAGKRLGEAKADPARSAGHERHAAP
jgi:hypothetical protein